MTRLRFSVRARRALGPCLLVATTLAGGARAHGSGLTPPWIGQMFSGPATADTKKK